MKECRMLDCIYPDPDYLLFRAASSTELLNTVPARYCAEHLAQELLCTCVAVEHAAVHTQFHVMLVRDPA